MLTHTWMEWIPEKIEGGFVSSLHFFPPSVRRHLREG